MTRRGQAGESTFDVLIQNGNVLSISSSKAKLTSRTQFVCVEKMHASVKEIHVSAEELENVMDMGVEAKIKQT